MFFCTAWPFSSSFLSYKKTMAEILPILTLTLSSFVSNLFFLNDYPINDWPYSKGFLNFGCLEGSKIMFWFGHWKSHFLWSENGHFCQKCPSLRPKKGHFNWPNQNSKNTYYSSNIPQIWSLWLLFCEFITFGRDFGHISILLIFGLILAIFPL